MAGKKYIYFSRTYRRTQANYLYALLYIFLVVLPVLILLVINLDKVTYAVCNLTKIVVSGAVPRKEITVIESGFVPFGLTYCVSFDSSFPTTNELLINLLVVVVIISILVLSSLRGAPITVYLLFSFMVHIISCVYFIFEQNYFEYTATDFSDIFLKQQISIWILFIVMMGILTAFVGKSGLIYKLMAFYGVLLYSVVFGTIRYIVFMYILARVSLLYMADMYFVTGPIFDFLYLVGVYTLYANQMQKRMDSPKGEDEWKWL